MGKTVTGVLNDYLKVHINSNSDNKLNETQPQQSILDDEDEEDDDIGSPHSK